MQPVSTFGHEMFSSSADDAGLARRGAPRAARSRRAEKPPTDTTSGRPSARSSGSTRGAERVDPGVGEPDRVEHPAGRPRRSAAAALPSRGSGVTVLVTIAREVLVRPASPAAAAASGSSVPEAFRTGCSSSTLPTAVRRSAITPPPARSPRVDDRPLDAQPLQPPVELDRAAVAGAEAAGHRRLERRLAGHARAGGTAPPPPAASGRRAGSDSTLVASPSASASGSVTQHRLDHHAALAARHELGGRARARRLRKPATQPRARAAPSASHGITATPIPPAHSSGRAPAASRSKPRPNGPCTSTSAHRPGRARPRPGPRTSHRNSTARARPRTADSGRPRNAVTVERAQHVEPARLRRRRTSARARPAGTARRARRARTRATHACSSCRLFGSTSQARPIACTAADAPAMRREAGDAGAEIAARRIW